MNKLDEILDGQLGDIQSLVEYFEKDLNEIEDSIEVINKLTDRDWGSKMTNTLTLQAESIWFYRLRLLKWSRLWVKVD